MTEQEAIAIAQKRERHKQPGLRNKHWRAQHDSVKGWHVALVDDLRAVADEAKFCAFTAACGGDMQGLIDAAGDLLIARVRASIGENE